MPMNTTLPSRRGRARLAASITCSASSPVVRWRSNPGWPVAQKPERAGQGGELGRVGAQAVEPVPRLTGAVGRFTVQRAAQVGEVDVVAAGHGAPGGGPQRGREYLLSR